MIDAVSIACPRCNTSDHTKKVSGIVAEGRYIHTWVTEEWVIHDDVNELKPVTHREIRHTPLAASLFFSYRGYSVGYLGGLVVLVITFGIPLVIGATLGENPGDYLLMVIFTVAAILSPTFFYACVKRSQARACWKTLFYRSQDDLVFQESDPILRGPRSHMETLLRVNEGNPEAAYNLGWQLQQQKDTVGARAAYQRAIESGNAVWAARAAANLLQVK